MTIFQKIGNFFSINYNNGNIGKWTKITGGLAMGAGAVGIALSSKSCGNESIFNGRSCCTSNIGMGMPYGVGAFPTMSCGGFFGPRPLTDPNLLALMQYNPMGIAYSPYAQMYGGYNANSYGMLNQMQTYIPQQQIPQNTIDHKAEYAGDLDRNQDNNAGQQLDAALDQLRGKDGNSASRLEIQTVQFSPDAKDTEVEYKEQISEIAKSYLADMDGNKDQKVTFEDFLKYEMKNLPEDVKNNPQAEQIVQNAFSKLDMNGDGLFDWKEAAAMLRTFDRSTSDKKTLDGKITAEEYNKWSELMSEGKENAFNQAIKYDYKKLFE